MRCKGRSAAAALAVAACVFGCADAGGGFEPSRARPSEATLCRVVLGNSTAGDVERILGAPNDTFESQTTLSYTYQFGNVSDGSLAFLTLYFDNGFAEDPFASGFPLPACWTNSPSSDGVGL